MVSSKMFKMGFGETKTEIHVDQLPIQGKIPQWLQGTLIRNGPGTFQIGDEGYRHWFDGLAMLHKFTFNNGSIAYTNKFLDTNSYREAKKKGKIAYSEFATDPSWTLINRIQNLFSPMITDSAKVNVAKMGDLYMALAETPIQILFDPQSLNTTGTFTYEDRLVGQMTTVHPHIDKANHLAYNLVTHFHRISHYNLYVLKNGRNPKQIASMPVKKPAYMHSFGMSENYIILAEFPLVVNSLSLLLWLKPYIENYQWKPQNGTKFTIINKHTGEIEGRYEFDPFFAFHHINAFEQGNEIIVDMAAYPDAGIIESFYLQSLKNPDTKLPFGLLKRFRIPLQGKNITSEILSDACIELPVIDTPEQTNPAAYRYVYADSVNPEDRTGFYNQLVKVDIKGEKHSSWYNSGSYPGEPVFVGRPGRQQEDDGVILSVVLDENSTNPFLLILDAGSFTEIARAEIPQSILFGYHGAFFNIGMD